MHSKLSRNRQSGLALIPALIVFVIFVVFIATMVAVIVKAINKLPHRTFEDPPEGPTTNTPPDSTFTIPYEELLAADGKAITAGQLQWLMDTSANTNAEFEVVILRSTNLVHWELLTRTNTVNHQVLWDDTNAPVDQCFYRPLIVIP